MEREVLPQEREELWRRPLQQVSLRAAWVQVLPHRHVRRSDDLGAVSAAAPRWLHKQYCDELKLLKARHIRMERAALSLRWIAS